jgi:protein O-GlcNAc transferase
MPPDNQFRRLQEAASHQRAGRFVEAIRIYNRVLQKTPSNFDCVNALAGLYAQLGDINSAIPLFRRAAKLRPDMADTHYNLAVALSMCGQHDEAAGHYQQVLDRNPRHANARNNYAATLLQQGRIAEALRQYDELISINPALADAHNNRGMALQALQRHDEALRDYDQAIALKPNFPEAYVNRGNALQEQHRPDEALASFTKAVALRPDFADAYNNIGNIHFQLGSYQEAIAAYDSLLALRADDAEARSMRFSAKMQLCDWRDFDNEQAKLVSSIRRGLPISPFIMLSVSSSIADHLLCAKHFNETRFPPAENPIWRGEIYSHDRIRIAYISGEFREHPVAYLMAGLFEKHDKSRFEVTAISFGPKQDTEITQRLKAGFERFIDVRANTDQEIAALIRDLEIDIAVDLVGALQGARPSIFARRPAPIQVNYLGYPGSMGVEYFDYIVADRTVLPKEDVGFYVEKVAWLPDSYLVTDDTRIVAESMPSRSELNLPDDGFVFCCFNQLYKINPVVFDVWMRLLRDVEGSVLWLREHSAAAAQNLRDEAGRRGIAPERLVFAPRTPLAADHLARQRQADLFLDTLPYNAHTTATEALWAGLPVITCLGSSFAGRVAASINTAAGMDELVTRSLPEYEALALKIAKDPSFCASLKDRLGRNRQICPLFDTSRFARHIETCYEAMWRTYRSGQPPVSFAVEGDAQ